MLEFQLAQNETQFVGSAQGQSAAATSPASQFGVAAEHIALVVLIFIAIVYGFVLLERRMGR